MEAIFGSVILDFISRGTKWAIDYFFNKLNGKNKLYALKFDRHKRRIRPALLPRLHRQKWA